MLAAAFIAIVTAGIIIETSGEADADISKPSVVVYTDYSEDYSGLAYLNEKLPTELKPFEWVRDSVNGFWYNVNEQSSSYGEILTYGHLSDVSNDIVRIDVLDTYSVFTTDSFQIVQIKTVVKSTSYISTKLSFDGFTKEISSVESMTHAGYYFTSSYDSYTLLTVESSSGDISGDYIGKELNISVTCNGSPYSLKANLVGNPITLNGVIADADDKPLADARVSYTNGDGKTYSTITDKFGKYSISANEGQCITVTSVKCGSYTFSGGKSFGSTPDPADVLTINANEHTVNVIVVDQSGNSVSSISVALLGFKQTPVAGGYEIVSVFSRTYTTDSNGVSAVLISDADLENINELYVQVVKGKTSYTVDVNTPSSGVSPLTDPVGEGNAFLDKVGFTDCVLKVKESSYYVTISSANNSAVIPGANVDAKWYEEIINGSEYTVNSYNGVVWTDVLSDDGRVLVHYRIPADSSSKNYYLVCSGKVISGSELYSNYTYSTIDPRGTSAVSLVERISSINGMIAQSDDSISDAGIRANENAYVVSYTVCGADVPEELVVEYSDIQSIIYKAGSTISFGVAIPEGMSLQIRVSADGYTLTNSSWTSPSMYTNKAVDVESKKAVCSLARESQSLVGDVQEIKNLENGDVVTLTMKINGETVVFNVVSSGVLITFQPHGWTGENVTLSKISMLDGKYLVDDGSGSYIAAEMKTIKFVAYNGATQPTDYTSTLGGLVFYIYLDGKIYATFTTDENGVAVIEVPDVTGLTYGFDNVLVTPADISSGTFAGYAAFCMNGLVGDCASFMVKYAAVSIDSGVSSVDVLSPQTKVEKIGSVIVFEAPSMKDFSFNGWYLKGEKVSDEGNLYKSTLTIDSSFDGGELVAMYSVDPEKEEEPLDANTIIFGALAIVIAVFAFAYVLLQIKKG